MRRCEPFLAHRRRSPVQFSLHAAEQIPFSVREHRDHGHAQHPEGAGSGHAGAAPQEEGRIGFEPLRCEALVRFGVGEIDTLVGDEPGEPTAVGSDDGATGCRAPSGSPSARDEEALCPNGRRPCLAICQGPLIEGEGGMRLPSFTLEHHRTTALRTGLPAVFPASRWRSSNASRCLCAAVVSSPE